MLKDHGYNVHITSIFPPDNVKQLSETKLLIIDVMNKNLQTVLSILKTISTTFHGVGITPPPILAIEDIASTEKQRLFSSGIRDYISIPVIKEELLYRIRNAIHHVESVTDAKEHKVPANEMLAIRTAEYLKSQIANEISLNTLTKEIGTNRNKLSSAFNQTYGMTVFSWIRQERMRYAAKLLKNTSLTILQVSESVGYPDSNNFSTAFRRAFNQSPREYRANNCIDASSKETHA